MQHCRNNWRNIWRKINLISVLVISLLASVGCMNGSSGGGEVASVPPVDYCPHLPSRAFDASNRVRIQGKAFYEYRMMGNMYVANGSYTVRPLSNTPATTFRLDINGTTKSYTCTSPCSNANVVANLRSVINADTSLPATATTTTEFGAAMLVVKPKVLGTPITLSNFLFLDDEDSGGIKMGAEPGVIRHAEVRVTDAGGNVVQCAETNASGAYDFYLPKNSGSYTVEVTSRSKNVYNTAYVLQNPTENTYYSVKHVVGTSADASLDPLLAPATGTLEGGAFNILDQIYKSQEYLRTETANCDNSGSPNYYGDCEPFTTAPLVYTYWKKGLSPGVYIGSRGAISFYLNGQRELYIGGGLNDDVESSDMDHFDNSVIVHEYGHFLEDQFAAPDSPGGSHNGRSIIDPRLAWGEGWADFFQAAVLYANSGATPYYRDTYGHVGCSGAACYGINYNENLDPTSMSYGDQPTDMGEGIFREFSVTRLLYKVVKTGSGMKFSEIWANLAGPTKSMKASPDPFKSMGRFHKLQYNNSPKTDWTAISNAEKQSVSDLGDYATPLNLNQSTCLSSNDGIPMSVKMTSTDDGSFSSSDQFNNNDFFVYRHSGGAVTFKVNWSGGRADLDLYIYRPGYVFGDNEGLVALKNVENAGLSGEEKVTVELAAGPYMINVMAYTGTDSNNVPVYGSVGTYSTTYRLKINNLRACPKPDGDAW